MAKRILYAVQGTGNGHLSRATDIVPALRRHGEVDVLVSGYQSEVQLPFPVKYHNRGLSFIFGSNGGISISESLAKADLANLKAEIETAPVNEYDLVINDFEPVTAWACLQHRLPCISFSHQAAVIHPSAPKPKKFNPLGKLILNQYAPTQIGIGFHFKNYGEGIATPLVKEEIRRLEIENLGHHTVYLPAYSDEKLLALLSKIPETRWHVFSKKAKRSQKHDRVTIFPVDSQRFQESLRTCRGVLCGAGFELPSEALFLGKKLLAIPMKGQFEQQCNAKALKKLGVRTLKKLSPKRIEKVREWVVQGTALQIDYPNETHELVDRVLESESWITPSAEPSLVRENFERFSGVLLNAASSISQVLGRQH